MTSCWARVRNSRPGRRLAVQVDGNGARVAAERDFIV
jgi:hypothetical protein